MMYSSCQCRKILYAHFKQKMQNTRKWKTTNYERNSFLPQVVADNECPRQILRERRVREPQEKHA